MSSDDLSKQRQGTRGTDVTSQIEQIFAPIIRLADSYLDADLDHITYAKIDQDRHFLENIHTHLASGKNTLSPDARIVFTRKFNDIEGPVNDILPHLYRARGHVNKDG